MGLDIYLGGKPTPETIAEFEWEPDEIPEWCADYTQRVIGISYGGFHDWRVAVAQVEGIALMEMDGYGGAFRWQTVKSPLKPLLNHSDCDGLIPASDCCAMYQHLRMRVAPYLAESWARQTTGRIATGMERACKQQVPLVFR